MAKFIGRRIAVGIAPEAVRGTGVSATHLLAKTNLALEDKADKARSGEGMGNIAGDGSQAIVAMQKAEGEIEAELGAKSFPIVLRSVLGSAISTAAEGTGYKHTVDLAENNIHNTFSIQLDDPNGDLIFEGCMVDSFELTVTAEDIVKWSAGIKSFVSRGSSFDATALKALDYKFVGRDLILKVAAATTDLAAATAICVKDLKFTINKNADYDNCLGSLEPEDILNKQITIQGSITLNYEDRTWRDYMLNGDYKAVGITLKQSRDDAGDQDPTFYLELPRVDFSEWESQRGNDEIVTQTINFNALLDIDNNQLVSDAYVINDVVSY